MNYMQCGGCKETVMQNCTGTCLACQRGFVGVLQEDAYHRIKIIDRVVNHLNEPDEEIILDDLKSREKEIEQELAN